MIKKINKNINGITLIALIITIIILLILVGISIATLTGENGILNKSNWARIISKLAEIEEQGNLISQGLMMEDEGRGVSTLPKVIEGLVEQKYSIKKVENEGVTITGLELSKNKVILATKETEEVKAILKESGEGAKYYAEVEGKYYEITFDNGKVYVARKPSEIEVKEEKMQLTLENENIVKAELEEITGNIKITGIAVGTTKIKVTYGSFSEECEINIILRPEENAPANINVKFATNYGTIDVIWLQDKTNTIANVPNEPQLGDMTKVTWTQSGGTWTEDPMPKTEWYNYNAGEGNKDNKTSQWANAKNSDGSYFVWIPRFAYRITYSASSGSGPTGYYDGDGMWESVNAKKKLDIDEGIETVKHNGYKYIVHPAFGTNFDLGGWDENLEGIWVAKYEMSRSNATSTSSGSGTKFKSLPNVRSAENLKVGSMFTYSKNYDSSKQSHMIKNSEWGALLYLAHSQYGRNGYAISVNDDFYLTGLNYGTTNGALASSTGNVYGVYDLAGGSAEYVAAFNSSCPDNGSNFSNGSSFAGYGKGSTKYATAYYREPSLSFDNEAIYKSGKVGDATKEVLNAGNASLTNSTNTNWFGHYKEYFSQTNRPFLYRSLAGGYDYRRGQFVYYPESGGASSSPKNRISSSYAFFVALYVDIYINILIILRIIDTVEKIKKLL